jgi:hypothetical protein
MTASGQDEDRTVVSTPSSADSSPKKRSPWLWVGLAGCAGLLCLALVGAAAFLLTTRGEELKIGLGGDKETPTTEITSAPTPTKVEAVKTTTPTSEPTATEVKEKPTATQEPSSGIQITPKAAPTSTATPTPASLEPTIGPIIFATNVTDDNQPVGANTTFPEDVEEIHAVFSYDGMSDSDTWERHWYQDGEEVGSGSGSWDAGENGNFDLTLTGGDGPLGAGTWKLEIHVNGELARTGTFVIQASATPTSPPVARAYKIAFARWDGGKHNLFIANTDGSGEQFVLERAAGPSWSVDGRSLYVYGEEGVDRQVREGVTYTWPDAGISNGVVLLDISTLGGGIPDAVQDPSWKEGTGRAVALSSNGSMLAYDATHGGPDRRIYFLGTAENQQFNIEIPGEQPDWSPNNNQVVYRSGRDGKQGIWISNRDDSGAHNITNEGSDSFPRWSPDGLKIAFHRDSGGNVDIYVMNTDGSNVRRLTDAAGPDTLPTWTPDGRIVFRSARGGSWGIYVMNADGSGQKQVIANADPGPDWTFGWMDVY